MCIRDRYQAIPLRYRQKALLFTDVAVEPIIKAFPTIKKNSGIIRYLVVGRFDPWRGFDILIEAFALALIKNPQIELEIIGDGADRRRLEMLIVHNGIQNKVRMDGKISIEDYYNKIRTCDIVINSCLKEGAVTTAFDSLSFGKPLIGIETGGYTRYFKPEYSIIIPLKGRKETINNLYNAIVKMSDDEFRNIMSCNAFEASKKYTWNIKGQEIANEIDHAYNNLR